MRRTSPREERRRRVLVEERRSSPPSPSAVAGSPRGKSPPSARYTPAARAEHQPRISDLLPLRPWTLLVWFLAGLCLVVGHATLHTCYLRWHAPNRPMDLSALNLEGARNLARWTSSCLLLASALLSVQILQLRRHRIDDYRARYRLWYYIILVLILSSMDAVAGLHRMVYGGVELMASQYAIPLPRSSLVGLLLAAAAGLGVRLMFEMRGSRGAKLLALTAGLAYLLHAYLREASIRLLPVRLETMAAGIALLLGHYLLLMSLVVYGRHVYLDAQGRLVARRRAEGRRFHLGLSRSSRQATKSSTSSAGSADDSAQQAATAKPTTDTSSASQEPQAAPAPPSATARQDADHFPATLQLSRSERRRLKKLQKRDRRAA